MQTKGSDMGTSSPQLAGKLMTIGSPPDLGDWPTGTPELLRRNMAENAGTSGNGPIVAETVQRAAQRYASGESVFLSMTGPGTGKTSQGVGAGILWNAASENADKRTLFLVPDGLEAETLAAKARFGEQTADGAPIPGADRFEVLSHGAYLEQLQKGLIQVDRYSGRVVDESHEFAAHLSPVNAEMDRQLWSGRKQFLMSGTMLDSPQSILFHYAHTKGVGMSDAAAALEIESEPSTDRSVIGQESLARIQAFRESEIANGGMVAIAREHSGKMGVEIAEIPNRLELERKLVAIRQTRRGRDLDTVAVYRKFEQLVLAERVVRMALEAQHSGGRGVVVFADDATLRRAAELLQARGERYILTTSDQARVDPKSESTDGPLNEMDLDRAKAVFSGTAGPELGGDTPRILLASERFASGHNFSNCDVIHANPANYASANQARARGVRGPGDSSRYTAIFSDGPSGIRAAAGFRTSVETAIQTSGCPVARQFQQYLIPAIEQKFGVTLKGRMAAAPAASEASRVVPMQPDGRIEKKRQAVRV